jgi:hypothetical protein
MTDPENRDPHDPPPRLPVVVEPEAGPDLSQGTASKIAPEPPPAEPPPPSPPPRRRFAPMLGVIGFLLLAGAVGYLWQQQRQMQAGARTGSETAALQQQVQQLAQQTEQLQHQPAAGTPAGLDRLAERVTRLEQRKPTQDTAALDRLSQQVASLEQRPAPDLSRIEARLAALEQQPPPDFGGLKDRIAALHQSVAALQQRTAAFDDLSQRVGTLAQQVQGAASQGQQADASMKQRLDSLGSRLSAMEQGAGRLKALAERANRLARLQAAQMALARGQKLGEIPGAPPPLARYADATPPTLASLRLAYPAAEQAALDASSPDTAGKPFFARVMAHAQELVTVRQGDRVLVGDPVAGVLAHARAALDAGDLAGAANAVASLGGASAQAMAGWLSQAEALLAARAALADMVAKS